MFVDYRKISDELHDKLKNKMKMFVTKYSNAKISDKNIIHMFDSIFMLFVILVNCDLCTQRVFYHF